MSATTKTWINFQAPDCEDDDLNGFKSENNNLIVGSGQSLNTGDNEQTHKAVAAYALSGQFMLGGGVADAYTANAPAPRINPETRQEGMIITFSAVANNTGACTLNAFGTGAAPIKLRGGALDPLPDDIIAGKDVTVIDRVTFFELVRTSRILTTVFSVGGVHTPAPDAESIDFVVVGAGGAGGGVNGQGVGTASAGGGGASGAYAFKSTNIIDASYTITVGAGGGGVIAGIGGDGGSSSVVSATLNINAPGGSGGSSMVATAGNAGANGGLCPVATGGDVNAAGNGGDSSYINSGEPASSGTGGGGPFGGAVYGRTTNINGIDGRAIGSGGSGAGTNDSSNNYAGGDGADGIIMVREYL